MSRAAIKHILALTLCLTLLTACTSPPPSIPTATSAFPPTPSATQTLSPTFTFTPSAVPSLNSTATRLLPTGTPAPTLAYTATPIPFSPTVKQVLIEYLPYTGGDGGEDTDTYMGKFMPDFVLYTDGQLILRTPDNLVQKTLSGDEICSLLSKIKATGFFEIKDDVPTDDIETHRPIYQSVTATADIGEGGSYYVVRVNGQPQKTVHVYDSLKDYVIDPVRRTLDLITNYKPTGLTPYQPQQVLLWIEPNYAVHHYNDTPTPTVQTWPTNLPALAVPLNTVAQHQELVQGEEAEQVLKLFNQLPGENIFMDQGRPYTVIARPLLPHESADNFLQIVAHSASVELPFKCAGP